jgi:hypothetical protein
MSEADLWDLLQWIFIAIAVVGAAMLVRAWLTSPRRNAK